MSGFKLPFTFTNPVFSAPRKLADAISDHSSLLSWWQAQAGYAAISDGKWATLSPRGGSDMANDLTQATPGMRATVKAAGINGMTSAEFDATNTTRYAADTTPNMAGDFAVACILKPTSDTVGSILDRYTDATNFLRLCRSVDGLIYGQISTTAGASTVGQPSPLGEWTLMIFEKTATNMRIRVNGQTTTWRAHNNQVGAAGMTVGGRASGGSLFTGEIADLMTFSDTVLDNAPLLAALIAYAQQAYGLTGQ